MENVLWSDYTKGVESSAIRTENPKSANMDKDAFLKLLITQMQYQDPTNPVDDKQFLAQMAQFTSLEQMQNLNKIMANSQSFALIGKNVSGRNYSESANLYNDVDGIVNSVEVINGSAVLNTENGSLKYSEIDKIY